MTRFPHAGESKTMVTRIPGFFFHELGFVAKLLKPCQQTNSVDGLGSSRIRPLPQPKAGRKFFQRPHPVFKRSEFHTGLRSPSSPGHEAHYVVVLSAR